jgi:hypothetical protein
MYSIHYLETVEHLDLISLDIDPMLSLHHQHLQSEPADARVIKTPMNFIKHGY